MDIFQIHKTDLDIATIESLNNYVQRNNWILVLSGGYATEALCGGVVTRPHGDMDLHIAVDESVNIYEIAKELIDILEKESTKWKLVQKTERKIKFVEDESSLESFGLRELELTVHKEKEKPVFTDAFLTNSKGKEVCVLTINVNELIASKIHSFYKSKVDLSLGRETNTNDIRDLSRLMQLSTYNKVATLELLAKRYVKGIDYQNSLHLVKEEFDYVESFLK